MATTSTTQGQNLKDDPTWRELYVLLTPIVKKRIYNVGLQSWHGQEYDLAEDVTQDTVVRTFLQTQKAQKGEVPPILSLFYFSKKVASNRLCDMVRKESRLIRPSYDSVIQEKLALDNWIDPAEEVVSDIENTSLFTLIAQVIASLPTKQRTALLIDLADLPSEDGPYSPLQRALEKVGIHLEIYSDLLPKNPVERGRHAALLSLAYKRVKKVVCSRLQLQHEDYRI